MSMLFFHIHTIVTLAAVVCGSGVALQGGSGSPSTMGDRQQRSAALARAQTPAWAHALIRPNSVRLCPFPSASAGRDRSPSGPILRIGGGGRSRGPMRPLRKPQMGQLREPSLRLEQADGGTPSWLPAPLGRALSLQSSSFAFCLLPSAFCLLPSPSPSSFAFVFCLLSPADSAPRSLAG